MKLNLYRVSPIPSPQFWIVAETTSEAGSIFVTYAAARGLFRAGQLKIELQDAAEGEERMPGLEAMLEQGLPGVADFTNMGWALKPPG